MKIDIFKKFRLNVRNNPHLFMHSNFCSQINGLKMSSSSIILEECQDDDITSQKTRKNENETFILLDKLRDKDHQSQMKKKHLKTEIKRLSELLQKNNINPQTGLPIQQIQSMKEQSTQTNLTSSISEQSLKSIENEKGEVKIDDEGNDDHIFNFEESIHENQCLQNEGQKFEYNKYLRNVESLALKKCKEVDKLINIIGSYDKKSSSKTKNTNKRLEIKISQLQTENNNLKLEIEKLNMKLTKIQEAVIGFQINHKQSKMERATQKLKMIATLKGNQIKEQLDLYEYIANEFEGVIDVSSELNEENIKKLIHQAALLLKENESVNC